MEFGILFDLLILCLVGGVIYWIVTVLPLPEPFKMIAIVIVLIIFLIVLLQFLFGSGIGVFHSGRLLR